MDASCAPLDRWLLAAVAVARARRPGCAHHGPPAPVGPLAALLGRGDADRRRQVRGRLPVEARLVFRRCRSACPSAPRCARTCCTTCWTRWSRCRRSSCGARCAISRTTTSTTASSIRSATRSALFDPSELWAADPRADRAGRAGAARGARRGWSSRSTRRAAPTARWRWRWRCWRRSSRHARARVARPPRRAHSLDRGGGRRAVTATASGAADGVGRHPGGRALRLAGAARSSSPLDALYAERQRKFVVGAAPPRRSAAASRRASALGELLLAHGDEMQRGVAQRRHALPARGPDRARRAAHRRARGRRRATIPSCARCSTRPRSPRPAPPSTCALARRFLPRVELLGGTATDSADPLVAFRVLEAGLERAPGDAELLLLSAHVARAASSLLPGDPPARGGGGASSRRRPARDGEQARDLGRAAGAVLPAPAPAPRSRARPAGLRRGGRRCASSSARRARALPEGRHQAARRRHRLRGGAQLPQRRADRSRRAAVPARARRGRADRRDHASSWRTWRSSAAIRGAPARSCARRSTPCAPKRPRQPAGHHRLRRGALAPRAPARRRLRRRGQARRRRGRVARGAGRLGAPARWSTCAARATRRRPRRRSRWGACSICSAATPRGCRSSTRRSSRTATATSRTST